MRWGTWYIPATLGLINVAAAPPETKVRTLFEEGFGVVGGAVGTKLGVATGLGIVAILGLGPFGLFVAVFICASVGGIAGMGLFKELGGELYDYYEPNFTRGRIYNSPDQLFLEAAK